MLRGTVTRARVIRGKQLLVEHDYRSKIRPRPHSRFFLLPAGPGAGPERGLSGAEAPAGQGARQLPGAMDAIDFRYPGFRDRFVYPARFLRAPSLRKTVHHVGRRDVGWLPPAGSASRRGSRECEKFHRTEHLCCPILYANC